MKSENLELLSSLGVSVEELAGNRKALRKYPRLKTTGRWEEDPQIKSEVRKRLLRNARLDPKTGCLNWIRSLNDCGYGHMTICGDWLAVHRLSFTIFIKPIHDGLHALHKCDNPRCINPLHLFLGTQADNVLDACMKGRRKSLKPDAVKQIRKDYDSGVGTLTELARMHGVVHNAIWKIVRRLSWKHLK